MFLENKNYIFFLTSRQFLKISIVYGQMGSNPRVLSDSETNPIRFWDIQQHSLQNRHVSTIAPLENQESKAL